jgi:mono/diheme cytochrome c family protein
MLKHFAAALAIVWLASALASDAAGPGTQVRKAAAPATRDNDRVTPQSASAGQSREVLDRYCVTCHNTRSKTGGLALDSVDLNAVAEHAELWEKVVRKLRSGSMPPPGARRPDAATYDALAGSLEAAIDSAGAAHPNPGRRPAIHRMNRAEYANAIRDLLAVDVDAAALLPPDDSGYGFDNIADVLSVSPMLTERYLAAALKISRVAVGDPTIRPVTETFSVNKYLKQEDRVSDDLPFGSRGGLAIRYYFPVDGDYVVKIFFDRTYDGRIRGLGEAHDLEVRLDGAKVGQVTVGGAAAAGRGGQRNVAVDGSEIRFAATAGPKVLGVSFVKKVDEPEGMQRPLYAVTSYEYAGDINVPPAIGRVELGGPFDVKGPGTSPSRARIFTCHPQQGGPNSGGRDSGGPTNGGPNRVRPASDAACARQILSTIARRAYRRPVAEADVQPLMAFYDAARRTGGERGFDAGIEAALRRILVSPDFLFRVEQDPPQATPGSVYRISDIELASRLSFFLWSSIPDDALLDAAIQGQLSRPAVLERHVRRMLADRRSKALVLNFAGQWLWVRNIRLHSPDPAIFPDFDENLREAFAREIELFLDSQMREDKSIRELLTADDTFLNERLARHYGIAGVYGNHFRRVTLRDPARMGLLGKGGLLTVTSYPHRTSPVLRGKWLLENILGAPPPPPPPDVPALKDTGENGRAETVRERMEQHRANPVCAACHKVMDPLGFALENFDAIGRWRTADAGGPIDPSGTLANGAAVDGPATLRQALVASPDEFVRTVTEKLLTYALGRGVEYYDLPAVRRVVRDTARSDQTWSSLILGITRSVPFQMRRSAAGSTTEARVR